MGTPFLQGLWRGRATAKPNVCRSTGVGGAGVTWPARTPVLAEFALHGVDGARINRIAERARAGKERIYAWFGDKDALFDTVPGPASANWPGSCRSPSDRRATSVRSTAHTTGRR